MACAVTSTRADSETGRTSSYKGHRSGKQLRHIDNILLGSSRFCFCAALRWDEAQGRWAEAISPVLQSQGGGSEAAPDEQQAAAGDGPEQDAAALADEELARQRMNQWVKTDDGALAAAAKEIYAGKAAAAEPAAAADDEHVRLSVSVTVFVTVE